MEIPAEPRITITDVAVIEKTLLAAASGSPEHILDDFKVYNNDLHVDLARLQIQLQMLPHLISARNMRLKVICQSEG